VGIVEDWEARGAYHDVNSHRIFVADISPRMRATRHLAPVLVLHGFPTSGVDWHLVVDALAEHRRVVVPDLLGYGFSDKPDHAYSLFEQADIVDALARELHLETVALVTHDMGDSVGGEVLARSIDGTLPFAIEQRVLTNGSIYIEMAHLSDGQQLLLSLPDAALPVGSGADEATLQLALRGTFAPQSEVPVEEVAAMAACIARDGGSRLLPRIIRYIEERRVHQERWTGAIERHPAPLDVIWGDLDPIAVWPMVERLHSARTDATVHRLDGVGHYPMVEAPGRFGAALMRALS
jgi:pimeloyl-ACP methyl ester carboxylesterase